MLTNQIIKNKMDTLNTLRQRIFSIEEMLESYDRAYIKTIQYNEYIILRNQLVIMKTLKEITEKLNEQQ